MACAALRRDRRLGKETLQRSLDPGWTLRIQAVKSLVVGTGRFFRVLARHLDLLLRPPSTPGSIARAPDPACGGQGLLQGQLPDSIFETIFSSSARPLRSFRLVVLRA